LEAVILQPRHRREHIGELVQIDGSEHRWFEDRAAACTLLVTGTWKPYTVTSRSSLPDIGEVQMLAVESRR
jgi:hypothetical protein